VKRGLTSHERARPRQRGGIPSATILASVHKKGLGSFTLPGLLKVNVINVPAKKKRRGIDPFTKVEREFAAKPATVRIKTRAP